MKHFSYESAKQNEKSFLSMTSLSVKEFDKLAITFDECWNEYTKENEKDIKKGGRPSILTSAVDRLFFILFYLKTYPLQEILAFSFEMSQAEANELIYKLSLVLKMALQKDGFVPPRLSDEIVADLKNEAPQTLLLMPQKDLLIVLWIIMRKECFIVEKRKGTRSKIISLSAKMIIKSRG
jgi:hypothetical protein